MAGGTLVIASLLSALRLITLGGLLLLQSHFWNLLGNLLAYLLEKRPCLGLARNRCSG